MNIGSSNQAYGYRGAFSRDVCRIEKGDRVFASLRVHGRTITEKVFTTIVGMTELLGEIRHCMRGYRGLVSLVVRNMSRGWRIERPLMLYPDPMPSGAASARTAPLRQTASGMLFPWETH